MTKYWIGTVSQEHVLRGVAGGFCQVCHGKRTAQPHEARRLAALLQPENPHGRRGKTASLYRIRANYGRYRLSVPNETFIPFRRNVEYAETRRNCPIDIIRTHPEWKKYAAMLRYGHLKSAAISLILCGRICSRRPTLSGNNKDSCRTDTDCPRVFRLPEKQNAQAKPPPAPATHVSVSTGKPL